MTFEEIMIDACNRNASVEELKFWCEKLSEALNMNNN